MAVLLIHLENSAAAPDLIAVRIRDRYSEKTSPRHVIEKGKTLRCRVTDRNGVGNVDIFDGGADPDKDYPLVSDIYVDRERLVKFPREEPARAMLLNDTPECKIDP